MSIFNPQPLFYKISHLLRLLTSVVLIPELRCKAGSAYLSGLAGPDCPPISPDDALLNPRGLALTALSISRYRHRQFFRNAIIVITCIPVVEVTRTRCRVVLRNLCSLACGCHAEFCRCDVVVLIALLGGLLPRGVSAGLVTLWTFGSVALISHIPGRRVFPSRYEITLRTR